MFKLLKSIVDSYNVDSKSTDFGDNPRILKIKPKNRTTLGSLDF